ncbi:MAG: protein-glutamate O-methyltransferase CheR [Leptospiraceae bacterium]|nr:protein-glutamate O-methyltransferase CheR [Leptospiraceae bacterium]
MSNKSELSLQGLPTQVQLKDKEFNQCRDLIYQWAGIHMTEAKKALVAGRLMKRIRHYNLKSYQEYIDIVLSDKVPEERQVMIDLLTTNETYFFREPKHFDYLINSILKLYNSNEMFRIWSAACSSGEEVYSLAMILAEHFGLNGNWEIYGSDISSRVLEEAKNALYPLEDTDTIPPDFLKKYCLKGVRSQEGKFTVDKALRDKTKFQQINLTENLPDIGYFDAIFLRNVMIYFNKETKKVIVEKLVRRLKPTGVLVVGHAESLHGLTPEVKSVAPTIYQKA